MCYLNCRLLQEPVLMDFASTKTFPISMEYIPVLLSEESDVLVTTSVVEDGPFLSCRSSSWWCRGKSTQWAAYLHISFSSWFVGLPPRYSHSLLRVRSLGTTIWPCTWSVWKLPICCNRRISCFLSLELSTDSLWLLHHCRPWTFRLNNVS